MSTLFFLLLSLSQRRKDEEQAPRRLQTEKPKDSNSKLLPSRIFCAFEPGIDKFND